MRRLLISLLFLPVMAFSQDDKKESTDQEVYAAYNSLQKVDGQYEFTEVVQLDSNTKSTVPREGQKNVYKNHQI